MFVRTPPAARVRGLRRDVGHSGVVDGPRSRAEPTARADGERYGLVLLLIALTLVAEALASVVPGAWIARLALSAATLLLVLRTTRVPVATRRTDLLLAVLVLAAAVPGDLADVPGTRLVWTSSVTVAVVAVQMVLIARRLARHRTVSLSTAAGALALYLLLGLLFAGVYGLAAGLSQQPVFGAAGDGTALQRLYFSLVTLTTTGYGDLVPGTDPMRMAAVLEALAGQLYLVTVVAVVVGSLPRGRSGMDGAGAGTDRG